MDRRRMMLMVATLVGVGAITLVYFKTKPREEAVRSATGRPVRTLEVGALPVT